MSSSRPPAVPAGVTEYEWRKFQAKKMRADMKATAGTSTSTGAVTTNAASSSSASATTSRVGASLDSAALQADMSRRYNLGNMGPRIRPRQQPPRGVGGVGGASSAQAKQTSAVALLRQQERQQKRAYKQYQDAQPFTGTDNGSGMRNNAQPHQQTLVATVPKERLPEQYCGSCDAENRGEDAVCCACGYFMAGAPMPAPQTLAQRRGLAPASAPRARAITPLEWGSMETALKKRDDSYCPICMEGFSHGSEVLLSCSHMFHMACLTAFEKFMAKDTRACPICRSSDYQKKITTVGSASYYKVCVGKIQMLYRGYVARKEYRVKLRGFYRNTNSGTFGGAGTGTGYAGRTGAGGAIARRTFFEKELSSLGNEMELQANARVRGLNQVVEGIDRTLDQGRDLDVLFDAMLRERTSAREAMGLPEEDEEGDEGGRIDADAMPTSTDGTSAVNTSGSNGGNAHDDAVDADGNSVNTPKPVLSDREWLVVLTQARNRGLGECAICMAPNKGLRNICMLSCSHIFHSQCIANFEKFISMSSTDHSRGCPICRSNFTARPLATGGSEWGLGLGIGPGLGAPLSLSD